MNKNIYNKVFLIVFVILFCVCIPKVSATSNGWGFKRNNNHEVPDVGRYRNEIDGTSSYYVGNTNEKIIYLTFDAGYDNGNLSEILNVLKQKNIKSTFFVTGDFLNREEELVKRMVEEGHIIGNHTYHHKNITTISKEKLASEISLLEDKYTEITGLKMVKYFRPPEGEFNKQSLIDVQSLGYKTFFWSIAYKDWDVNSQLSVKETYDNVINNLHNGAIILMHTVSKTNALTLASIVEGIINEGYQIQNLDYLVNSK